MTFPILHVHLLGAFQLIYNARLVIGVNSLRLQSLLALLVLHAGVPQSRQHIAFLLWPDTDESHARNNLRQLLHQLRQTLPDPDRFLVSDASTVYWQMDQGQVIDVEQFENALRQAEAAKRSGDMLSLRQTLERAVSLYQGELLPGCYDEWVTSERERLRQQRQNAYQELVRVLEGQRQYATALEVAQQLLQFDPLDEATCVALMRLHILNEDVPGARRVYQTAVETLRRELDVEPGDALRAAFERLQGAPRTIASFGAENQASALKLIGRNSEWQQLQAAWRRATRGDAHVVLVNGEAGIGKSRLAEELFNWAARQGFTTAYTRSYGAEGGLVLAPVTDWLRNDTLRSRLKTLDRVWLTEIARLLPELLSEHTALPPPEPITEYGMRQRFFEALARAVIAAPRPLLLWIDDMHWCDAETLEWLHYLLRFDPRNALLVVGTARSEESPPEHPVSRWAMQLRTENKVTVLELAPLDAAETSKLASQVQGHELDINTSVRLFRETQGNPLFVIETVRAGITGAVIIETDAATTGISREAYKLPPRVYALIAGRLAQLTPSARKMVELGAASGRAFTLDLLVTAAQEETETVVHALDELWQRRIIREQSANTFDFTHDRLRDVTYAETSAPLRRLFHRRIAQALEVLYAENLASVSAQIAAQYEHAGMIEQAIPYYKLAGEFAASVYANEDAITLLARGLELLAQLPLSAKRDTQELNLLLTLSPLYTNSRGWTSLEVEQTLKRALHLSHIVGDKARRAQTLFRLQTVCMVQGRFREVLEIYPEMHGLFVETQGSPPSNIGVNHAIATFHTGHILEAREHFTKIVAERDERLLRSMQASHSGNYLVQGYSYMAHASWLLGHADAARVHMRMAIDLADEFAQPYNQAFAATYLATLELWDSDLETFRGHAEQAYTLASEFKAPYYRAWTKILAQYAQGWREPNSSRVQELRDAIGGFIETRARTRLPFFFSLLGRACLTAGHIGAGLEAVEQAFAHSRQNNEPWWDSEIHRLYGELLLAQGVDASQVEAEFQRALELARTQQAKALELRAATSLAQLWQADSRAADAKQLLAPLYAWFTEGFETPDLQNARALLARFGASLDLEKSRH